MGDTRLFAALRERVSLTGVRTVVLLIAASLSISGYVYAYLKEATAPTDGELLTVVRGRGDTPLSDARIEVLTVKGEPVTSFSAAAPPGGPRIVKEGTYRMRVSRSGYTTETRMVQVIAGHTSEVRFRLAPPAVATPRRAPAPAASSESSSVMESIKRVFGR